MSNNSFSIILPVYNLASLITKTLDSIEESIDFYYKIDNNPKLNAEVIVVNDASTDNTLDVISKYAKDKKHYKILNQVKKLGIGSGRNTGVKASIGNFLFLCDGDDFYLKEHIYLCLWVFNYSKNRDKVLDNLADLPQALADKLRSVRLPVQPVDVVKTKVKIKEKLHPYWQDAIENTIALNACVTRKCHEFVGGFPESYVYKRLGRNEDQAYFLGWIGQFYKIYKLNIETVEYMRYPGNNLDRQLKKFQTEPSKYDFEEDLTPELKRLYQQTENILERRLLYLKNKYQVIQEATSLSIGKGQGQATQDIELAIKYHQQGNLSEAEQLYRQILQQEPESDRVLHLLGVLYYQSGNVEAAINLFQQVLKLKPDYAVAHNNLGLALLQEGRVDEAIEHYQQAVALKPNSVEFQKNLRAAQKSKF